MKVKIKDYLNHYSHYFGYVIFLMICCVGVYKINQSFEMNDAFWHIKTGEWIVQHGMVKNCIGKHMLLVRLLHHVQVCLLMYPRGGILLHE